MYQYKSRRNCAQLIRTMDGVFVQKKYQQKELCQREVQIYSMLQNSNIPCAKLILVEDRSLLMTHLPGRNLVDILEQQEKNGHIDWTVWDKLADWLVSFWKQTEYVMTDVNLQNFLYDDHEKTLYGLDFEECAPGDPIPAAAKTAAYILHYAPEKTPAKEKIAEYVLHQFSRRLGADAQVLFQEAKKQEALLLERRKKRI